MINGAYHDSEGYKILSDFGRKWSVTWQPKYRKFGNTNTVQEANTIAAEAVEAVIHDKNKVNKQRVKFFETKSFRGPKIVDSDSETELYGVESLNLESSGKDSSK